MKYHQFIILFILFSSLLLAQAETQVGLNLGFNHMKTSSIGGSINYSRIISKQLYFTSTGGYFSWGEGDDIVKGVGDSRGISSTGLAFLSVGGKFYFSKQSFKPYMTVEWEFDAYLNVEQYAEINTLDEDGEIIKEYITVGKQHPMFTTAIGWTFGINQRMYDKLDFDAAVASRIGLDFDYTVRFTVGIVYNI